MPDSARFTRERREKMAIDEFWKLLEGLPPEGAEDALRGRLEALEPAQIVSGRG